VSSLPTKTSNLMNLGSLLIDIAELSDEAGDAESARKDWRYAVDSLRSSSEKSGEHHEILDRLASALSGLTKYLQGDEKGRALREAVAIRIRLAASTADIFSLARAISDYGLYIVTSGAAGAEEARALFEQAFSLYESLLHDRPNDLQLLRRQAVTAMSIGQCSLATNDPDAALKFYGVSAEHIQRVIAAGEYSKTDLEVLQLAMDGRVEAAEALGSPHLADLASERNAFIDQYGNQLDGL